MQHRPPPKVVQTRKPHLVQPQKPITLRALRPLEDTGGKEGAKALQPWREKLRDPARARQAELSRDSDSRIISRDEWRSASLAPGRHHGGWQEQAAHQGRQERRQEESVSGGPRGARWAGSLAPRRQDGRDARRIAGAPGGRRRWRPRPGRERGWGVRPAARARSRSALALHVAGARRGQCRALTGPVCPSPARQIPGFLLPRLNASLGISL